MFSFQLEAFLFFRHVFIHYWFFIRKHTAVPMLSKCFSLLNIMLAYFLTTSFHTYMYNCICISIRSNKILSKTCMYCFSSFYREVSPNFCKIRGKKTLYKKSAFWLKFASFDLYLKYFNRI